MLLAAGCRAEQTPPGGTEVRSDLADQREVAVTIYNEDLALIKDRREIALREGRFALEFREVSGRMQPQTAMLRAVQEPGRVTVLEQNFNFDLLTPGTLLEKYVGREVRFIRTNPATGELTDETATVLSANEGVVVRFADRIETNPPGRLIFEGVPPNLRDRPTLVLDLDSRIGGSEVLELSYLSGGLSWQADYVAELNADDSALDLLGWVTVTNRSGAAYRGARLQLVAGDVNQVREKLQMRRNEMLMAAVSEDAAQGMSEESLFEYHLYTLGRPTDIADNQTKQVSLLDADQVPARRELVLEGTPRFFGGRITGEPDKPKVAVFLSIMNDTKSNLGLPLPNGIVRVYKRDSAGNAQFVGEDRIDHTPEQRAVKLKLGNAFDVTAERRQLDYRRQSAAAPHRYQHESEHEIRLFNAKEFPATVTVREPLPGEWQIIESSHTHRREDAGTATWQVEIPARGEAVLTYRAQVRI
jgi:hypothetical protein